MARTMTKERQGEIALMYLKDRIRHDGIHIIDLKRKVHAKAKEIGISAEEAMEFVEIISRELLNEVFSPEKSTLETLQKDLKETPNESERFGPNGGYRES